MKSMKQIKEKHMGTIREEFIEGASFWLTNMKVEWCHTEEGKPDTKFGKSQWSITIRLDDEWYERLKEVGFTAKKKSDNRNWKEGDEDYNFIVAYTKTHTTKGENKCPVMKMKDTEEQHFDAIGNGSVMDIKIWAKYIDVNGDQMLPCYLDGGLIRDLVVYTPEAPIPEDDGDRSGSTFNF